MNEPTQVLISIVCAAIVGMSFYNWVEGQGMLLAQREARPVKSLAQLIPRNCDKFKGQSKKWADCMMGNNDE